MAAAELRNQPDLILARAGANNMSSAVQSAGRFRGQVRLSGSLPGMRQCHGIAIAFDYLSPGSESRGPAREACRRDRPYEADALDSQGGLAAATRRGEAPMPRERILCRHAQAAEAFSDGG